MIASVLFWQYGQVMTAVASTIMGFTAVAPSRWA